MKIEKGATGDVIWTKLDGKDCPLPTENVYVRASDGHVFVGGDPRDLERHLHRLRPHEPAMIKFWLKGREIVPNLFAGRMSPDG